MMELFFRPFSGLFDTSPVGSPLSDLLKTGKPAMRMASGRLCAFLITGPGLVVPSKPFEVSVSNSPRKLLWDRVRVKMRGG